MDDCDANRARKRPRSRLLVNGVVIGFLALAALTVGQSLFAHSRPGDTVRRFFVPFADIAAMVGFATSGVLIVASSLRGPRRKHPRLFGRRSE